MRSNNFHVRVQSGFTLIELLVVIAIIGLLASIILASLSTARSKGLDAERISDVKSLETAMELYYNDHGTYPQSAGSSNGDVVLSDPTLNADLVPTYIASMPAILVADGDHYYGVGTGGGTNQYGLYIITSTGASGACRTGVSTNMAANGWWGINNVCDF